MQRQRDEKPERRRRKPQNGEIFVAKRILKEQAPEQKFFNTTNILPAQGQEDEWENRRGGDWVMKN